MGDEKRLRWTSILVLTGIVLGYVSYPADKLGLGEIYPFADWRLYSAPVGINEPATSYRVYSRVSPSESWTRHSYTAAPAFSRQEIKYMLGYWSKRYDESDRSSTKARAALRAASRALVPDADEYRIVAETYYSLPLYADPTRYDTATVAHLTR